MRNKNCPNSAIGTTKFCSGHDGSIRCAIKNCLNGAIGTTKVVPGVQSKTVPRALWAPPNYVSITSENTLCLAVSRLLDSPQLFAVLIAQRKETRIYSVVFRSRLALSSHMAVGDRCGHPKETWHVGLTRIDLSSS